MQTLAEALATLDDVEREIERMGCTTELRDAMPTRKENSSRPSTNSTGRRNWHSQQGERRSYTSCGTSGAAQKIPPTPWGTPTGKYLFAVRNTSAAFFIPRLG